VRLAEFFIDIMRLQHRTLHYIEPDGKIGKRDAMLICDVILMNLPLIINYQHLSARDRQRTGCPRENLREKREKKERK